MKIVIAFPPHWEEIKKTFPEVIKYKPVITYGDTLYNPFNGYIDPALEVHEQTHAQQQGFAPKEWWAQYLISPKFRLSQEIEAYRNQYKYMQEHYSRDQRRNMLKQIIKDLSSSLYGNIINAEQAKKEITQ